MTEPSPSPVADQWREEVFPKELRAVRERLIAADLPEGDADLRKLAAISAALGEALPQGGPPDVRAAGAPPGATPAATPGVLAAPGPRGFHPITEHPVDPDAPPGVQGPWIKQALVPPPFRALQIEQRRKRKTQAMKVVPRGPTTQLGLTGLCLSGGGIRSATFSLGVLQVLAREKILERFDYLSTVSGGGYIGSCLSSLMAEDAAPKPPAGREEAVPADPAANAPADLGTRFPFRHTPGVMELDAMRRLRAGRHYLAPGGLLDIVRIPALILRGAIMNLIGIMPFVMLAVALTALVLGPRIAELARSTEALPWGESYRATVLLGSLFLGLVVAWPFVSLAFSYRRFRALFTERWTVRNRMERIFAGALLSVGAAVAIESLPLLIIVYHRVVGDALSPRVWTAILGAVATLPSMIAGKASENVHRIGGKVALVVLGLVGPGLVALAYVLIGDWLIVNGGHLPAVFGRPVALGLPAFVAVSLVLLGITSYVIDANGTSLHGFYRDRLSRAYLLAANGLGQVDVTPRRDGLRLSKLSPRAPYHLVNATLNLQGDSHDALRGREADFFLFSRHFTGSRRTGWCATEAIEQLDLRLNLGTAMAISGAAASPNMGTSSIKTLVFLMGLLNVRLGYWLPNPGFVGQRGLHLVAPRPGPALFVKELLSRLDGNSWYVNVSDGGHLENLGLYPLLERRCRFIVAVDGERDEGLQLGSLARLIRYARIDKGIDIEIDLSALRKRRSPEEAASETEVARPQRHWALGTIDYGQGETGYLLYVKSCLTGDENPYIREYRDRNPGFPHESTGDQFFSEEQFEAYRALGAHAANDLFAKGGAADALSEPGGGTIERWFQYLAKPPPLKGRAVAPVVIPVRDAADRSA